MVEFVFWVVLGHPGTQIQGTLTGVVWKHMKLYVQKSASKLENFNKTVHLGNVVFALFVISECALRRHSYKKTTFSDDKKSLFKS